MKIQQSPLIIIVLLLFTACEPQYKWVKEQGEIFGTTYNLVYESPGGKKLHRNVRQALDSVNQSLSTYDTTSVISRFNRAETGTKTDSHFRKVYETGLKVTDATNGAFDMTIAPLVNAWGFGFTESDPEISSHVDSLLSMVGMEYTQLKNDSIIRKREGVLLDASAIAKGYGVDVAARTLKRFGCRNYLVEIGGEVITYGENPRGSKWRVGIDRPIDDPTAVNRELELIVELSGEALASSGNYRQFYIDESGKKYSHTIDPHTGHPVDHSLLSASIVADECMVADAYATACMVLGTEKSLELIKKHPDLEGCFIYDSDEGMKITWTEGFEKFIAEQ